MPQMVRALGANVEGYIILGLALSNGLVAFSGALAGPVSGVSLTHRWASVMIVWGLLQKVIIGEALTHGGRSLGLTIVGADMGSILFRLLVAIATSALGPQPE